MILAWYLQGPPYVSLCLLFITQPGSYHTALIIYYHIALKVVMLAGNNTQYISQNMQIVFVVLCFVYVKVRSGVV